MGHPQHLGRKDLSLSDEFYEERTGEMLDEEQEDMPYNLPGYRPCTPTSSNLYQCYSTNANDAWTDLTIAEYDA